MGQAKARGTYEERSGAAIEARDAIVRAREEAQHKKDMETHEKWKLMTPEQREAALEDAKAMARMYGELSQTFGHDVALALVTMEGKKNRKKVDTAE